MDSIQDFEKPRYGWIRIILPAAFSIGGIALGFWADTLENEYHNMLGKIIGVHIVALSVTVTIIILLLENYSEKIGKKVDLLNSQLLAVGSETDRVVTGFQTEFERTLEGLSEKIAEIEGTTLAARNLDDAYKSAISAEVGRDHNIPEFARALLKRIGPAFDELAKDNFHPNANFFREMNDLVSVMRSGDTIAAVCGRKFWDGSAGDNSIDSYWKNNLEAADRGALIMRVFVPDMDEDDKAAGFSPEISETIDKHVAMLENAPEETKSKFQLRILSNRDRDELRSEFWLDPRLGFALLTKNGEKIVSLHRLSESDEVIRGKFISNYIDYALFVEYFYVVWKKASPLDTQRWKTRGSQELSN